MCRVGLSSGVGGKTLGRRPDAIWTPAQSDRVVAPKQAWSPKTSMEWGERRSYNSANPLVRRIIVTLLSELQHTVGLLQTSKRVVPGPRV